MRIPLFRRLSVLLAVLALVAAACGDDTTDAADEIADDGAADDSSGDDSGADDGAGDDTGDDTADDSAGDDMAGDSGGDDMTDDMDEGGGDVDAYCALARQADAADDTFNPATMSAPEMEDYWRTQFALMQEGALVVPDELSDDFAVLTDAVQRMIELLETNDWNIFAVIDPLEAIFDEPAVAAASDRLDAFDADVCGIVDDAGSDLGGDDEQAGFDDSPYCQLSFLFDQEVGDIPFGEGPDAVQAYYDDVLSRLGTIHGVAPEELRPHIDVIGEGISTIYLTLESHGFDLAAAESDMIELTSDPAFTQPMDDASAVLETYDSDVCGLIG